MANKIDARAIKGLENGGPGGGGIPEAPINSRLYGRSDAAWKEIVINPDGSISNETVISFPSLVLATAATIPTAVNIIAVIVSGNAMLYRRYTFSGPATEFIPLKTNGGTVNWAPAEYFSPLHWGAVGDGVANDRDAIVRMLQFMYGTPATNGDQENAFANQKPFVIDGRQRVYGVGGPVNLGNTGAKYAQTGMAYRLRIHELSLKALAGGNWSGNYDDVNGIPRALLIIAWQFPFTVFTDAYTGMMDITIDHLRLDCNFQTSGIFLKSTYQCEINGPRIQQIGKNGFGIKTSDHRASENVNGYGSRNGALMIRTPNIEGKVTESGQGFPGSDTALTMGTVGIEMRSLDFRIDAAIISHVSKAMVLEGRAGQIYNIHPWSNLIEVGLDANNLMFVNGYIDYNKFLLKSFKHKFIGVHWIIPGTDTDEGIELQASLPNERAEGLLFIGCTFDHYMDIKFTTTGSGSWAEDKTRKLTMIGCHYGPNNTTAQIERYADRHGIAAATGAHWFRNGDWARGEIRLNSDTLHVGKDRGTDGVAIIHLQSGAGDQSNASLTKESGPAGFLKLANTAGGLWLETSANDLKLWNDGNFTTKGNAFYLGGGRIADGTAELFLINRKGTPFPLPSGVLRAQAGTGVELQAQMAGGWLRFGVPTTINALGIEATGLVKVAKGLDITTGDARTVAGRHIAGPRDILTVTDRTLGVINTHNGQVSAYTNSFGAPFIGGRDGNGPILTMGRDGSALNSISVSGSTISYPTTSDERLKEDLKKIDLTIIDDLSPYDFRWTKYGTREHGFMAQREENKVPHLVVKEPITLEDGTEDFIWGIDKATLIPLLVATVQDLRKRIDKLENPSNGVQDD